MQKWTRLTTMIILSPDGLKRIWFEFKDVYLDMAHFDMHLIFLGHHTNVTIITLEKLIFKTFFEPFGIKNCLK